MSKKTATRGVQSILNATFEFEVTDTMVNTSGTEVTLNASDVFEVINLPQTSQVVGGDLTVVTASDDTGTHTVSVGDATNATRYANAVNIKAAARTALTLTGYQNVSGENIQITLAAATGDATVGRVILNVAYVVTDRVCEVQTH